MINKKILDEQNQKFDEQVRTLAKEIFIRNKESQFARENTLAWKEPAVPQVGLFFIQVLPDKGFKLYTKKCNLREGELKEGIKAYPTNHCTVWRDIQEENLLWMRTKYLDIPRGSVAFDANNIKKPFFIVTLPPRFKTNKALKDLVLDKFSLPEKHVKFRYEQLY